MHEVIDETFAIEPKKLLEILPHRYPFLLIDEIVHADLKKNFIIGKKNVTFNEPFFMGHFPNAPIMPGVLIVEAMAQTAGVLMHEKKGFDKEKNIAVLLQVESAKFRKAVVPGCVLLLHVEAVHLSRTGGKVKARALIEEKLAVEATLTLAIVAKSAL